MDTTKVLIIGAIVVVLGGVGWFTLAQNGKEDTIMQDEKMMEKTDDAMMEKDTMKQDEGAMMEKKDDAMMTQ